MVLLADFPLTLLESLILQGQVVNLIIDLHSEVVHGFEYLWVSFLYQSYIVTFV